MQLRKFFRELKRRKVYHVAISYGITAWLMAQVLSLVTDTFNAPDWVMQMTLVLLLIGFPVALILAWAYELSPDGVIRTDSEDSEENPFTSAQRRPMINILIISLLIIAVVFLLFSRNNFFEISPNREIVRYADPNSIPIAMLPLINLSEDKALAYFSTQVTNDIINELAKVRPFAVTAFSTVYGFQDLGKSPRDIAEELDVTYLMRGSARAFAEGDSIKIDVELVDPFTGRLLWVESYQELMDEAPSLQVAIARKVAANLNVRLSVSETESLKTGKTRNGQAYLKFIEARQEFSSLQVSKIDRAVTLLEEAIDLDPTYAEAHTLLAWVLTLQSWPAFKENQAKLATNRERIKTLLNTASKLNPASSDIFLVRANYAMTYLDDVKLAEQMVQKALEINSWPELPTTLCICTAVTVNVVKGNLKRAKEIADVARKVEPGNIFILNDSFFIDMVEGDMDGAAKKMEQALQLMDVPIFRYQTGWAYFHQGRYEKAIELLLQAYKGQAYTPTTISAYLSNAYYKAGDRKKSEAYKDTIEVKLAAGETHVLADLATIAAVRGQDDLALTYLERHQKESIVSMAYLLNVDPVFRKYEGYPRFRVLREKMKYYE